MGNVFLVLWCTGVEYKDDRWWTWTSSRFCTDGLGRTNKGWAPWLGSRNWRSRMLHLRCRCTHRKPLTEEFTSVVLMSVRVVRSGLDAVSVWWVYLSVSMPGGTLCALSICRRWCLSSEIMLVMNTIWNSMELPSSSTSFSFSRTPFFPRILPPFRR
jgi:hypothetical protein